METLQLGWIGLGNMGIPMAQQLTGAGYPVTVYNRSKGKTVEGAATADSPAELIAKVDVVFLMVSDDAAIRELFTQPNGLLSANTSGKLIINMSTVSPGISRECADVCQQQGNTYLDAPVSGSVVQAQSGQLVVMAGGEADVVNRARPVLEKLGKLVLHVGPTGAGNIAKLAINSLLAIHAQGLAEATAFAQQNGIKAEDMLAIVNNSALGNVFAKIKGDAIIQQNFKPAFALKLLVKDLGLAQQQGINTPLAQASFATFKSAMEDHGNEDLIAVVKQFLPNGN